MRLLTSCASQSSLLWIQLSEADGCYPYSQLGTEIILQQLILSTKGHFIEQDDSSPPEIPIKSIQWTSVYFWELWHLKQTKFQCSSHPHTLPKFTVNALWFPEVSLAYILNIQLAWLSPMFQAFMYRLVFSQPHLSESGSESRSIAFFRVYCCRSPPHLHSPTLLEAKILGRKCIGTTTVGRTGSQCLFLISVSLAYPQRWKKCLAEICQDLFSYCTFAGEVIVFHLL